MNICVERLVDCELTKRHKPKNSNIMGGEGSMSHANQSLKQNRALLRKANYRKLKNLYLQHSAKLELEFKEVSSKELAGIKNKIRLQHKQNARKELVFTLVAIILAALFFVLLYTRFIE